MEIDLVSLFFYLIDKWKLLFLGAVVGVVLAGALVFFQTPMYESNSTLYVLSKTTSITSITDLQVGTELTSDFSVIATSKPVINIKFISWFFRSNYFNGMWFRFTNGYFNCVWFKSIWINELN